MKPLEEDILGQGIRKLIAAPEPSLSASDKHASAITLAEQFRAFIKASNYPCVGAKSALSKNQMTAYIGSDLESSWDDVALANQLVSFAHAYKKSRPLFITFAAFFPKTRAMSENEFEAALWERIASLQAKDKWFGQQYDEAVSPDPTSPKFSLSFGGQSFFVVGMHPAASRPARQFDVPVLIFNLHDQFERLREDGRYEKMRSTIIDRDVDLAGSVNPMLSRHGEMSEARQYAGRIVGPDWVCPWPGREDEANET